MWARFAVLATAAASLLGGLTAALALLGFPMGATPDRWGTVHGQLMILGFVGTLIALERAIALRASWAFAAPALLGLGGIALLAPIPVEAGRILHVGGVLALVVLYSKLWGRAPSVAVAVEWLGAGAGLGAAILWLGGTSTPGMIAWPAAFLVLTIAGERLELAHVGAPPAGASTVILGLSAGLVGACALAVIAPSPGNEIVGVLMLAIALWVFRYDVARRLVLTKGLPRFSAATMLAGSAWLTVAGVVWAVEGPLTGSDAYDVVVHCVTLGWTFSMIMAHAPIIFPAVLRRPVPYRPVLWVPAALLHGTLLLRVYSYLRDWVVPWQVGGVGGVTAVLLTGGLIVFLVAKGKK